MNRRQAQSPTGLPGDSPVPLGNFHQAEDARRAALNLIEDAVQARQTAEQLNAGLRESEGRFRTLFELGPVAVYSCDASGLIREFNRRAAELWGRAPALGDTDQRFCGSFRMIRPDGSVLAHEQCPMAEVLSGTVPYARDAEVRIERPDGSQVSVVVNIRPLKNEQGEITGAINCFYDITQRKEMEIRVRESEERYRTLTEQVQDYAIFRTDVEGRALTWNQGVQRILGFDERGFIGQDIVETIFTPEDVESGVAQQELDTAAAKGTASNDRWMRRKNGERFFANGVTTGLKDDTGKLIGFTKVMRDTTERKRTLEFHEAVMLGMAEGLYTVDAEGRVISVNPAAEELLGWKREELLGRRMHDVTHYKHRDGSPFPADECAGLRVLREGAVLADHEDVFIRKDGTFFDVVYSASPLRERDQIVGLVVVFRDRSQRLAMEQEIKRQAAQLADESRRKDEFLAMLSHELRNPLAPIRSAVHVLRRQERGSENRIQQEAREIIERQVGNLTKLVNDLLEVSRVVSGRVRLDQQTVDLNQVVQHATETARPLTEQRKHVLVLHLRDEPIWVNADATRLEEVFINLLSNAAKYTDEGGRIEVHCEHPLGGSYVQVRVRDNGMGIDKELLPRIFDLFTQADHSLARSSGGLGIGLSLAQRLVALHGGTIEAHSPPPETATGSEFIVKLPMAYAPDRPRPVDPDSETAPQRDGLRVLVVDDNIDQVTMLANALRDTGYSVQSAYTGPDGLKVAQQWRPDIVLLDIGLPGLDGYEVARRLRSAPDTSATRLIAITGYARDTDIALAREAGFDAHLTKPVEFGELEKLMASPRTSTAR